MSDDAESTTVKLRSKQEQLFEVEWAVACRSATLAIGSTTPRHATRRIARCARRRRLSKVIEYCKYHHEAEAKSVAEDVKNEWDRDFVKGLADDDGETLYNLMLVANYLGNKPLLVLTNTVLRQTGLAPIQHRKLNEWFQGFGTMRQLEIGACIEPIDSAGFEAAKRTLRSVDRHAWTDARVEVTRTWVHEGGVHEKVPCNERGTVEPGAQSTFLLREGADGAVQAPAMKVAGVGELTLPMCEALGEKTVRFAVEILRPFHGNCSEVTHTIYEKRYVFEHNGILSFELTHVKKGKGRLYLIEEATAPEYKAEIKFHCGSRPAGQPDPATYAWWYTDSMLLLVADLIRFSTRPNIVHYLEGAEDIFSLILSKLAPRDLARAARVCKAFRDAPFPTSKNAKATTMERLADMRKAAGARPAPPPRERPPSPPPPLYGLGYGDGPLRVV